jgi:hypothetical protein
MVITLILTVYALWISASTSTLLHPEDHPTSAIALTMGLIVTIITIPTVIYFNCL